MEKFEKGEKVKVYGFAVLEGPFSDQEHYFEGDVAQFVGSVTQGFPKEVKISFEGKHYYVHIKQLRHTL